MDGLDRELIVGEREQRLFAVDLGVENDFAAPELIEVAKRLLRVLELEVAPVVMVFEVEHAVLAVIRVLDLDDGNRSGADVADERFFDRAPVLVVGDARDDLIAAAALVLEEIQLADQIFGEIAPEEGRVALDLADLENLFPARFRMRPAVLARRLVPAALDVLPDLDAEMVGVDRSLGRAQHLVVAHDKLDLHSLRQAQAVENALVPEARPAFVHDFGLDLRNEILRLFVDDREEILLPVAEDRIVVADKEQQVLFGIERDAV